VFLQQVLLLSHLILTTLIAHQSDDYICFALIVERSWRSLSLLLLLLSLFSEELFLTLLQLVCCQQKASDNPLRKKMLRPQQTSYNEQQEE